MWDSETQLAGRGAARKYFHGAAELDMCRRPQPFEVLDLPMREGRVQDQGACALNLQQINCLG